MKRMVPRAVLIGVMVLLASCKGIGEGSTVQKVQLAFGPVDFRDQAAVVNAGLATQKLRMFDCFCSNLTALGTFTDGTLANFSARAKWTSSDPSVVAIVNYADLFLSTGPFYKCPFAQRTAGLLVPQAPGTAVVSAEFLGLTSSFTIEVADTAVAAQDSLGASTFVLKPTDTANVGEVAVGALLPLRLYATLDGRPRLLNLNVTTFSIAPVDTTVAQIDSIGQVAAYSADLGVARTAKAEFGTCSIAPTAQVRIGEVVPPMTLAEEPNFASDHALAVNSSELLQVTAMLDFDGDGTADGSQIVGDQSLATFTDPCTTRVYDATVPTTNCQVNTAATCDAAVPVCSTATATACPSSLTTACRVTAAPMAVTNTNRILAITASANPTTFSSTFPARRGLATMLSAAITDPAATSITIASTNGYPTIYPWEGVIGTTSPEIVQVTAASGATLTVRRGYSGSTAQAWPSGETFNQRSFSSGTVDITSTAGTLTTVAIDSAPSMVAAQGSLQLQATGTYSDSVAMTSRTQRITRLDAYASDSPGLSWASSNLAVASVNATGLVSSTGACGGTVVIRARASTSTDTIDTGFATTITTTDVEPNGNDDANDAACTTSDPLCDQVTLTIPAAASPPLLGATCS